MGDQRGHHGRFCSGSGVLGTRDLAGGVDAQGLSGISMCLSSSKQLFLRDLGKDGLFFVMDKRLARLKDALRPMGSC